MAPKKQNKPESKEIVVTRILEQTQSRTREDIGTWRSAIATAENIQWPNRSALYRLYNEVLLDTHIQGLIRQRLNKVLSAKFRLVNQAGEEASEAMALFNAQWFNTFMELAMQSRWWGHSLIQLWERNEHGYASVELVPRAHVIPEYGGWSVMPNDMSTYYLYREAPYWEWLVEVGTPRDHGLFKMAAPQFIFKKNASAQWSQYTEVFGMPLRVGKTTSRQQSDMQRMADNLRKMGSASYAVFQEGESVEFVSSAKGDGVDVYDKLIERANSELSKLIMSQTMTTDNGSSRSQAEVHERVAEDVIESDKRLLQFVINDQLLPKMAKHGFAVQGLKFEWQTSIDLEALWSKTKEALQHYNVKPDWIEKTFGIPVEEKASPSNDAPLDNSAPENTGANKKKALKVASALEKLYSHTCGLCGGGIVKLADNANPFSYDSEAFLDFVWLHRDNPAALSNAMQQAVYNDLWGGFSQAYGGNFEDVEAARKAQQNLFGFAQAKTYTMQDALIAEISEGMSRADFAAAAQPVLDKYNGAWRNAEYEYTFASAQQAQNWQRYQLNKALYPYLQYQTVGDARVREEHAILDGLTLRLNDAKWNRIMPPNGFGCRCSTKQTDDSDPLTDNSTADTLVEKAKVLPQFQNNTGKTGIVFKPSHPYFSNAKERMQ